MVDSMRASLPAPSLQGGSTYGQFWIPSSFNSPPSNTYGYYAVESAPFSHGFGFLSNFYPNARASILALFCCGCPPAVVGLVISFVVLSFYGVFGGRREPHVAKEVGKGFHPPITNPNPSRAVLLVALLILICAPVYHSTVGSVGLPVHWVIADAGSVCSCFLVLQRLFHISS